ncbi:hypothetical protein [Micromonospora echinofusca]|uniref:Sulfotransferase family protein n=1 Tax=Micromonospora echinofusca TaxID=47858 RepID=A0ABS3W0U8_MICEH|nr:hypothetical protein [Micromonospora echinofusca]MBO4210383.1 hypothetical protein [Micromonospora echinofusca]
MVISLMKSGTHLIQELMVALGYGIYGQSRIPAEIRPVLDDATRDRVARMVYDEQTYAELAAGDPASFAKAGDEAWEALGWAWQQRLGMPLVNRYGVAVTNNGLIEQALRRTATSTFATTPGNVCWVLPELDIKKVDGRFLQEWTETGLPRILFMYRDPRDVLLSMVNFLCGRTAQGYGNFSEFQIFNRILESKADLSEKLTYALTDPAFPVSGDHERALWLLNHPNVCQVSFEQLVGARGGGSDELQAATVARVLDFLGCDDSPDQLVEKLFRTDSFSFFKGQIGSWREAFGPEHEELLAERLGRMVRLYGYA